MIVTDLLKLTMFLGITALRQTSTRWSEYQNNIRA